MMSFIQGRNKRPPRSPVGEMPFFDHLEELRWRIVWSLLALIVGTALGFYLALSYDLMALLKRPLDPYMDGEALLALSITDPLFITFKVAITIGILLAMPVIVHQMWLFLSPALHKREKRAIIPALYMGAVLFGLGVTIAYVYVLPMTLRFMAGFQTETYRFALTAGLYFSFVLKLLVAFGVLFELPVVVLILAALGLVTSKFLREKRRFAIAGMAVISALLTPGDAITATVFMMGPLILLYELSIVLARLVERSRAKAEARDLAAAETL